MKLYPYLAALVGAALAFPLAAQEQKPADCPFHGAHTAQATQEHHAGIDQRGDQVMGFSHTRTTHNFLLEKDGGVIQVEAAKPEDAESLAQIRTHLAEVARAFSAGDFSMPREIHGRVLPGVPEMTRLKDAISYRYEEIERGARVRITTASSEAREAVHAFLRSQIDDHRTGDSHAPSP